MTLSQYQCQIQFIGFRLAGWVDFIAAGTCPEENGLFVVCKSRSDQLLGNRLPITTRFNDRHYNRNFPILIEPMERNLLSEHAAKIMVLSVPKAGTYLVGQILKNVGYTFCSKHVAEWGYQEIPKEDEIDFFRDPAKYTHKTSLENTLSTIENGEFAVGHLPCNSETSLLLSKYKKFFIHRDLRVCLCSYMRYTERFPSLYPGSEYSKKKRLEIFLENNAGGFFQMVSGVVKWTNEKEILELRFEDLQSRKGILEKMSAFIDVDSSFLDEAIEKALGQKTHTKNANHTVFEEFWSERVEELFCINGGSKLNEALGY